MRWRGVVRRMNGVAGGRQKFSEQFNGARIAAEASGANGGTERREGMSGPLLWLAVTMVPRTAE